MVTTRPPKTIVKLTALGPVANTDTKLLIYGLFQKGRVLAQDGTRDGTRSLTALTLSVRRTDDGRPTLLQERTHTLKYRFKSVFCLV